jgi:hypothetical protein
MQKIYIAIIWVGYIQGTDVQPLMRACRKENDNKSKESKYE